MITDIGLGRLADALRGPGGRAIVERIKSHPLAPRVEGSQGGATAYQLAHIYATGKDSKWRRAGLAVAEELGYCRES